MGFFDLVRPTDTVHRIPVMLVTLGNAVCVQILLVQREILLGVCVDGSNVIQMTSVTYMETRANAPLP